MAKPKALTDAEFKALAWRVSRELETSGLSPDALAGKLTNPKSGNKFSRTTVLNAKAGSAIGAPFATAFLDYLKEDLETVVAAFQKGEPTSGSRDQHVDLDEGMPHELKLELQRWRASNVSEEILTAARLAIGWARGGEPPTSEQVAAAVKRELKEVTERKAVVRAIENGVPDAFDEKGTGPAPAAKKRR